jgi:hypothetical protein
VHRVPSSSFFLRYLSNGSRIILQRQEVMFSFHSAAVTEHRVSHSSPIFGHICFEKIYNVNDRVSTASQSLFSNFLPKAVTPKTRSVWRCRGSDFPFSLQPPVPNPAVGHSSLPADLTLPLLYSSHSRRQSCNSSQIAAAIPFSG